jgi:hypothetical protein
LNRILCCDIIRKGTQQYFLGILMLKTLSRRYAVWLGSASAMLLRMRAMCVHNNGTASLSYWFGTYIDLEIFGSRCNIGSNRFCDMIQRNCLDNERRGQSDGDEALSTRKCPTIANRVVTLLSCVAQISTCHSNAASLHTHQAARAYLEDSIGWS